MNDSDQIEAEHMLKGLPRLRFKRPGDSLAQAKQSHYRWWWEFLRLSKDYWLICQTAQRKSDLVVEPKTRDATLASMYRRFGDIHSMSFEAWWEARGYRVFSEQKAFPEVTLVASAPRERPRQSPPPEHIWVEIPLKLSARTIKRRIGKILSEHAEQRLADRRLLSSAAYKLSPSRLNLHTLQRLHEVYCLHRELIAKPMALNRTHGIKRHRADYAQRADLFRIGKLLRISPSNESLIGTPQQIYAKQNQMRVAVSRLLKQAQGIIANCEQGVFPRYQFQVNEQPRFSAQQRQAHEALEIAWWSLDLRSELSAPKLDALRAIHYQEAERTRQSIEGARQRRVIKHQWV